MEVNDIAAAEKVLYDMNMEEANWRKCRATVGELLEFVKKASKEVKELDATKQGLESQIKTLGAQLEAGHNANKQKHDTRMEQLRLLEKDEEAKLTKLENRNRQIAEEQQRAEEALSQAQANQYEAERQLLIVEKKLAEAQQLLTKLTQIQV